jgi:hypothetical protein
VFKLLLTVFLGVCVGAVVADLLFGPDQPATPSSDSQGQHWEPWRSWYAAVRRGARRVLAAVVGWLVAAGEALERGARRFGSWVAESVQLVRDTATSVRARRSATAERNAAHARHVAHLERVAPRHDPLPPPVAPPASPLDGSPPLDGSAEPGADMPGVPVRGGRSDVPGVGVPLGPAPQVPEGALPGVVRPGPVLRGRNGQLAGQANGAAAANGSSAADGAATSAAERAMRIGPPMGPPPPVGPPVPASRRGQELIETSEMPAAAATDPTVPGRFEPLGRPPWDALIRRPTPQEAPGSGTGAGTGAGPGAGPDDPRPGRRRRRARRDPLAWSPDGGRVPDPEWDEGVPAPLVPPKPVRVRSAAVLLALTGVFGVVTATAFLVAVIMAVGALDKL